MQPASFADMGCPPRDEYVFTEKGLDLRPVLVALVAPRAAKPMNEEKSR
jgi:DNA-binding HxlR family transcriptional regulator